MLSEAKHLAGCDIQRQILRFAQDDKLAPTSAQLPANRQVTLTWTAADRAQTYLLRYGIQPDKLYQHHLIRGGASTTMTLYSLNNDPPYHFRLDAMNASGITQGAATASAP